MFYIDLRLLKVALFYKQTDRQMITDFTYHRHPRLCTKHLIIILLDVYLNVSELTMAKVTKCHQNMNPKDHQTTLRS